MSTATAKRAIKRASLHNISRRAAMQSSLHMGQSWIAVPAPATSMPVAVVNGPKSNHTESTGIALAGRAGPPARQSKVPMSVYDQISSQEKSEEATGPSKPHLNTESKPASPVRKHKNAPQSSLERQISGRGEREGKIPARANSRTDGSKSNRLNMSSASARIRQQAPDFHLEKTIRHLAMQKPTPVSLAEFHHYGISSEPKRRLHNAQFLYHELPIRIAQRVVELQSLPHGLSSQQPIKELEAMYRGYIKKLINSERPKIASRQEDLRFTEMLRSIFLEHSSVVQQMALGVLELRDEINAHPAVTWNREIQADIDNTLNRFYTARIGLRMLVEHHISSHDNRPGFSGVLESNCRIADIAQTAAEHARYLCEQHLGDAPEITIHGALDSSLTYIPSHIHYCLTELLKNSVRATMEHHTRLGSKELPPVRIVIARGNEDVIVKISDEGGGIPRSEMEMVWTYLHSTAERPPALTGAQQEKGRPTSALAGYGVGMPLSRLYAEYFGGSLDVKSMESFGTDSYLHLNRLGNNCENLPRGVRTSPGNLGSEFALATHKSPLTLQQQRMLFYDSGLASN